SCARLFVLTFALVCLLFLPVHVSIALPPLFSFYLLPRLPPLSSLFPYTTLFRSGRVMGQEIFGHEVRAAPVLERELARGHRRRRSEEHTSELQSRFDLVCRLLLEKKKLMVKKF